MKLGNLALFEAELHIVLLQVTWASIQIIARGLLAVEVLKGPNLLYSRR